MEPNIIPAYGCAKLQAAPPDYPCVARLRHCRLLSFLWLHAFKSTFEAMAEETKVLLSLPRMERLIAGGMWGEAIVYACRFLPRRPPSLPAQRTHLTEEAQTLLLFLHMHRCFADVVAGNEAGAARSDKHRRRYCLARRHTCISSHAVAIRRNIQTLVLPDQIRESMDWGRVREKVVRVVRRLVHDTPELAGFLDLPGGMVKPHNVLPIGFGFRSNRHVRQQSRPRATTIAKLYLEMKRCFTVNSAPVTTDNHSYSTTEGLSDKARGWMANILGKTSLHSAFEKPHIQAYVLAVSLQNNINGGIHSNQVRRKVLRLPQLLRLCLAPYKLILKFLGLLQRQKPVTLNFNRGISLCVQHNYPLKLLHLLKPFLTSKLTTGVPDSIVLQTKFDTTISHGENSGISLVTNADADMHSSQEHCHSENYSQGFTHPREELAPEEDIGPKRQQTTVTFGEANLSSIAVAEAEDKARPVELSM
uniref:Uncharacterized protein n=1 Tax=Oryza meridionalis TaxID=40149 RepID=A0A0E0DIB3_9ORYZ